MKSTTIEWFAPRRCITLIRPAYCLLGVFLMLFMAGIVSTSASVPVDHFSCGALPSSIPAGQPLNALVQADDVAGNFTTNFSGTAMLTTMALASTPSILITEVETINNKQVELSNLSTNEIDLS